MRQIIGRAVWRALIRRLARARGFPDPAALLTQISRFAQPAEVLVPTELLRLGLLLQARGLLNGQAFQHNLDWIWPYWVERQFDPRSPAFVPRGFSATHINLTHRNWTALGVPGCAELPIVDPRGLVTPLFDGWSLDGWIVTPGGDALAPSRAAGCAQAPASPDPMTLETVTWRDDLRLRVEAGVTMDRDDPTCWIRFAGAARRPAWLVVALRPCNPEGLSLVHHISLLRGREGWIVNGRPSVRWDVPPDDCWFSCYRDGDVFHRLRAGVAVPRTAIRCPVGTATAAARFRLDPVAGRTVRVEVPLGRPLRPSVRPPRDEGQARWARALDGAAGLHVADPRVAALFQAALRTLILHTPGDVYAGPYTYKRFWFRDAVQIAHALMCAGLVPRAGAILDTFADRQDRSGYFRSQHGEWDSNGQVLWAYSRFSTLTGTRPPDAWIGALRRGAAWIRRRRVGRAAGRLHAGLMPAGFSAEHLGANDFYYWDDFWSIAGLGAAAALLAGVGRRGESRRYEREADALLGAVVRSLTLVAGRLKHDGMPASPYRRLDSGAVGSLVAGYPLHIWSPDDRRLRATMEYLMARHVLHDALFHDIAHSGLNPYLTLHLAQVLLRAGDPRFGRLVRGVAALASPTGRWPEAAHPTLKTGCMGDGEHAWAAAEWIMMIRNSFVRDEPGPPRLVLGSGVLPEWVGRDPVAFGPTPTPFGPLRVTLRRCGDDLAVDWQARWRRLPAHLEVAVPGYRPAFVASDATGVRLTPDGHGA